MDGNDQAVGTSRATAFKSVLRAAQVLNHGDSVVIAPGVYREESLFAERFSADGSEMSIVGDESGRLTGIAAGPVVIRAENPASPALEFHRFRHLRISGLTFRGSGQGLVLEQCLDVVVERSTFDGLSRGLAVRQCEDVGVESTVFTRCILGAVLQNSVRIRLAHLTMAGSSSAGIVLLSCGSGAIRNSILANNNTNMIGDEISAPAWTSDYNVVSGGIGPWGSVPAIANVYEWAAASGQDRHSIHVVPAFDDVDKYDLHPAAAVNWPGGLPGAYVGTSSEPKGVLDRDGRPFTVLAGSTNAGAYAFAEPRPAPGWRRLAVNLEGRGPRQSAGVYRPDGALVRTLLSDAAGVHDLWWDGLDDLGQPAPVGRYQIRAATHDARLVDDGAMGDNGSSLGAYNCDNADRVAALPDGGFVVTTVYDEAGYPLRRYSSSGQPIFASNLTNKDFAALARSGDELYGIVGSPGKPRLQRIQLPGNRARMANGAEDYRPFGDGENPGAITGLALVGKQAYIAASELGLVRVIDLATGGKKADWPLPGVADLAADPQGTVWAICGNDVVALDASGRAVKQFATGLEKPRYLAASPDRLAVVDRGAGRLAVLDAVGGRVLRTIGKNRAPGAWTPVGIDTLRDPRGCAFLPDGRLVLTEQARVRILWPESGKIAMEILSNFMDVAVVHPAKPEFVYCNLGIFSVDPKTGAWKWLVEEPQGMTSPPRNEPLGEKPPDNREKTKTWAFGSPSTTVVLDGRPFIAYETANEQLFMFDVSDSLRPRLAMKSSREQKVLKLVPYSIITFSKNGDIIANGGSYGLRFARIPFKGLDPRGNPIYDFAKPVFVGAENDPSSRGMKCINAPSADRLTGDIYYLAVTDLHKKMVPAWGADGTGVGKSTPDGKPLWFALSSGGNYQSGAVVNDGKNSWFFAGKSFGGQIDLFDADGLRLTTGNWGWRCHYSIGFVDERNGVFPYVRPDGKVGAYVEDDAIGRFARCRLDGAETVRKVTAELDWNPTGASAGPPPDAQLAGGKSLERIVVIPKVAPLKVDGDWSAWVKAGVAPQIVSLPIPNYVRNWPRGLWQDFRAGTSIGAVAHDGKNLYVYFLVADDTLHFDSDDPGRMWEFDSVALWVEEEQIGLGFVKSGAPALFKYRYHNREGKEWSANYALPSDGIWGTTLADLSAHPLGRQLADYTSVSLAGRSGYALMGRIPMEEIKLVGGIAGRKGGDILPMTGAPGEIIRIGVALGHVSAWGREQDFNVCWPATHMFSDPTRNIPFVLGR